MNYIKRVLGKIKGIKFMFSEYQMIKDSVLNKGYTWFESGDYDLNIIWIRMSDTVSNMMGDYCQICYKVKGVENVITIKANTLPGLYGGLYNPVTVRGITGTAIVQPQQVLGAFHYNQLGVNDNDNDGNPFHSAYFNPIKSFKIWRDNDKDQTIDHIQSEDSPPEDQICWHYQGEPISAAGYKPWSIGCLGWLKSDLKNIIVPVIDKAVAIWGSNFTLTLIMNSDLIIPIK